MTKHRPEVHFRQAREFDETVYRKYSQSSSFNILFLACDYNPFFIFNFQNKQSREHKNKKDLFWHFY